jgi:NADH:ubiquinone oxidoreductase subunit F (NADH-binding)
MEPLTIIEKIKQSGLCGRGGAGYPTGIKWEKMYKKNYPLIYICVNGSEGEPGTKKDGYILQNYLKELIEGIKIAYQIFPQTKEIYIYLRKDYYEKYKKPIEDLKNNLPLIVFKEPGGYLCGENTVLINSIEGKRLIPRSKPPYCSEIGLWEKPTLVNNIETFFRVYQIVNNQYQKTRYYTLTDTKTKRTDVYDLSLNLTIDQVLRETGFYPNEDFFVQAGGGASGSFFTKEEIKNQKADLGTGAIIIYYPKNTTFEDLLNEKLDFFLKENCGFCTPCREGIYYLSQIKDKNEKIEEIAEIANTLYYTSFCGLGEGAGSLFKSLITKKDKIWPR